MKSARLRSVRDILLLVLCGLLLLFAQSAYWLNHTIFDKQSFTSIVTPVMNSSEAHTAIASTIVDRAFADKPIVSQLIGGNVTSLVSGLLGTDFAQQVVTSLVDRSYGYLATSNPQPIEIDLTVIKTPAEKIIGILQSQGQTVNISAGSIPDTIVLFNPSNLPDIYGYSVMLLWFGPLFWLGAIVCAVLYIYLGRARYAKRVYWLGGMVIVTSVIGMLVGPLLPPPVAALVPVTELRGIIRELADALLAPFTQQMVVAVIITVSILIIFYLRFAILRSVQRIVKRAAATVSSNADEPQKIAKAPVKTAKIAK